jgi:hypothetical protein
MAGTADSSAKDPSVSSDSENHMEEWKQARGVLALYDDRLHDVRKYGFSFLTALLAAEFILVPSQEMLDQVKFAVFAVTLILIAALQLLDKNYQVFQRAAFTRAQVLERKLNLELSEIISARYRSGKVNWLILSVYLLFIVGVLLLGGFVLQPQWVYVGLLLVVAIIVAAVPILVLRLRYVHREEDWTISPLECAKNESVRITLNNMNQKTKIVSGEDVKASDLKGFLFKVPLPIVFQRGELIFEIRSEDGSAVHSMVAKKDIEVYDSYTWIWNTSKVKEGVYQLRPRHWPLPLHRRIIVSGSAR